MAQSSDDDSDISESEIEDYKEKPYEQLRAEKYKVKGLNGVLRCPFCAGKKKQDYKYKDLLQHASGVGKGSSNRSAKQKANHLALAKYLENDLATEAEQVKRPVVPPPSNEPMENDLFVWPWTGIVVNIRSDPIDGRSLLEPGYWMKRFEKYRPLEVSMLNDKDGSGQAIVRFNNDWSGFVNATDFEKAFETDNHGQKDWNTQKSNPGSNIYSWCARAADYNAEGPIGEYLRSKGKLRTINEIVQEASESRNSVVANLASKIDLTNENLSKIQYQYNEKTLSLSRMLDEKDKLHEAFLEETRKLQRIARHEVRRVMEEQEKLNDELEAKRRKLDAWSKQLNKKEALTEMERQKLEEEKKKKEMSDNSLQLATREQKIADENVLRLAEEQKREKEELLKKILELEKQLDAKQKLEMDIEQLKGKLQVMKHLGKDDDATVQQKMSEMKDELKDKEEDLNAMEEMNLTLIVKERQANDELQEARKELIEGLKDLLGNKTNIGLKRMGELDQKFFFDALKEKFSAEEAELQATTLCSLWQENLKDSNWHPIKVVEVDGVTKEIVEEDDEKLQGLRQEWGKVIYDAVVAALRELHEYNPSGRYVVSELWNFKEKRKATLKEVIAYIISHIKTLKRKRT